MLFKLPFTSCFLLFISYFLLFYSFFYVFCFFWFCFPFRYCIWLYSSNQRAADGMKIQWFKIRKILLISPYPPLFLKTRVCIDWLTDVKSLFLFNVYSSSIRQEAFCNQVPVPYGWSGKKKEISKWFLFSFFFFFFFGVVVVPSPLDTRHKMLKRKEIKKKLKSWKARKGEREKSSRRYPLLRRDTDLVMDYDFIKERVALTLALTLALVLVPISVLIWKFVMVGRGTRESRRHGLEETGQGGEVHVRNLQFKFNPA